MGSKLDKMKEKIKKQNLIPQEDKPEREIEVKETYEELSLLSWYPNPRREFVKGGGRECKHCNRKDYFAYEVFSVEGSKDSANSICMKCLEENGYRKVFAYGGWKWVNESGTEIPSIII